MTWEFARANVSARRRFARHNGETVPLRPREFAVLSAIAKHAGQVLSRDRLMDLA
jgi:DNA-binding response OmpR family regulator